MSAPEPPLDTAANQGKFGTCSAYAMFQIIAEVLILKYDVNIPFDRNIDAVCDICDADNGSNAVRIAKALNEGRITFRNSGRSRKYKIKVTISQELNDFDTLYAAVERAKGTPVVYVSVDMVQKGISFCHALAAERVGTSTSKREVLCINSWGDKKVRYPCCTDNLNHFHVVDVHIVKTWDHKNREIENPACREGAQEMMDGFVPGNHGAKCIADSVAFYVVDGFSSHRVSSYRHPDDSFARDGIPGDAGPGYCGSNRVACDGCSNNRIYSFSDAVQRDMLAARRDATRAQGGTSIDQRNRWRVRADEPRSDGCD